MLTKTTTEKLKKAGIDVAKLETAIKAEAETDVEIPELFTPADVAERDVNTKKEGDTEGFTRGKATGIEIANKVIVKKFNLADVDAKSTDAVVEALNSSVAKGDDGLKETIKLLQKDKETGTTEREALIKKAETLEADFGIIKHFPANRSGQTDEEFLMLTKMNLQFEKGADGNTVVKRDGKILTNETTRAPLSPKEAIAGYFGERKWVTEGGARGGRGGDDSKGGGGAGIKNYRDAIAQYSKEFPGKSVISPEATAFVVAIAKDYPDFDYNTV